MERNYFIEGLFVLLALALVVTIIKYPKQTLIVLPLGIANNLILRPIKSMIYVPLWIIGMPLLYLAEKYNWNIQNVIKKILESSETDDQEPYRTTRNLHVDFECGSKFIFVIQSNKDIKELLRDFLDVFEDKYTIGDFEISTKQTQTIIECPTWVSFYDFHLIVQYVNGELGSKMSFGIFKSDKLNYYVYQDSRTLHNLVGFTSDKKLFSIYILGDLDKKQQLRLNQKIEVETEWIEKWI